MDNTATDWGASGLAWLTGPPDGPPDFSRAEVLTGATRVADHLRAAAGVSVDAASLLTGRAALSGFTRGGRASAGAASRLIRAADGWWAITLSRPDDIEAVPALLEADTPDDRWAAVSAWAAGLPAAAAVERARLLDIPAAVLGEAVAAGPAVRLSGPSGPPRRPRGALVVDLTSMWAGPLCGRLLAEAGATVIKVESHSRPDGTRRSPGGFFDWMNAGKLSCAVDFNSDAEFLRQLIGAADIVLEGSRPAALARRGLGPDQVPARPGRVWLRITGYGTDPGCADRAGFGDDTAVAGGLVGGGPVFCGDAIADPLTGLEAAAAVVDSLARGGGEVITLSLAAVAARYAALPLHPITARCPVLPPRCPRIDTAGPVLGAHNSGVRQMLVEAARSC